MARSESGRIVVELEPSLKRRLYSALAMDNQTLKDWMIKQVEAYLSAQSQKATEKVKVRK
ncbi:hypothetical protein [Hwanghaeella sp. LZ110]|uniref:hypothetical protein n=1 Tax=Hwanghaeella sp. LZ110 TaxID=3402810 RepID=UPI003B66EC87